MEGKKELLALQDGYRESEQSWSELLLDLKHRGLEIAPKLAIADGGLGFWAALRKTSSETKEQRCTVHKTANVLNKMPKSIQPKAKSDLHEIWQAATREDANKAFDHFLVKYEAKYQAACECLKKDRDALLTFYEFPAEQWAHLRSTNPIESTFATIRLRHKRNQRERHQTHQPGHDVQTRSVRRKEMATTARLPTNHPHPRRTVLQRRNPPAGNRRLIHILRTQHLTIAPFVGFLRVAHKFAESLVDCWFPT